MLGRVWKRRKHGVRNVTENVRARTGSAGTWNRWAAPISRTGCAWAVRSAVRTRRCWRLSGSHSWTGRTRPADDRTERSSSRTRGFLRPFCRPTRSARTSCRRAALSSPGTVSTLRTSTDDINFNPSAIVRSSRVDLLQRVTLPPSRRSIVSNCEKRLLGFLVRGGYR